MTVRSTLRPSHRSVIALAGVSLGAIALAGPASVREFAPAEPVDFVATAPVAGPSAVFKVDGVTEYSHGDPTGEEQYLLELMNRARSDPSAEADRVQNDYGVARVTQSVDFFLDQRPGVEWTRKENHDAFDGYVARPPFALSPLLSTAARKWSQVQIDENLQRHEINGYPNIQTRFGNEGYVYSSLAESIYAYADSAIHAHAGLAIDWGQAVPNGESRPALGHRNSLMNFTGEAFRTYREVGVGILTRNNPGPNDVGPRVCTIDFASSQNAERRFVVGVCYADENENGICDPGEGIAGVRVDADTSSFYAITSSSGGYAIPVTRTDGAIEVTTSATAAPASLLIGEQSLLVSTYDFDANGGNTKADFSLPPAPPTPDEATVDGGGGVVPDPGTLTKTFEVGALSGDDSTVGDIRLALDLAHADRTQLHVSLESPDNTTVVLFDGALPGADLVGTFGGSLRSWEPLANFVGRGYQGTWTLRITDKLAGVAGTLSSCQLRVRPGWVRDLHAPTTGLFLTKLKLKDKPNPATDVLVLKAETQIGAALALDAATQAHLVIRESGGARQELLHLDLSTLPSAKPKRATLVGGTVSLALDPGKKGTSRGVVVAKVKGIDLPAMPANVDVELALGDAIIGVNIPLTNGVFAGSKTSTSSRFFRIDSLKSKLGGAGRVTKVKGRFGPTNKPVSGIIEIQIGDFAFSRTPEFFTQVGTRWTYKGDELKKLVFDTAKGTFTAKLVSDHAAQDQGTIRVLFRAGACFGEAALVPRDVNGALKY